MRNFHWSLLLAALLSACGTLQTSGTTPVESSATWAVLPVLNRAETALAGQRMEDLVEAALRARRVSRVLRAPTSSGSDTLFDARGRDAVDKAASWAQGQGARYGIRGSVTEWRYKVGVDGEPAVGVTLEIVDLPSGKVVYSGAGGRTGWSREAVSAVAQNLVQDLLAGASWR